MGVPIQWIMRILGYRNDEDYWDSERLGQIRKPGLDESVDEASPVPKRLEAFLRSIEEAAAQRKMNVKEYADYIIKKASESLYPTLNCLTQTELEDASRQRYSSPRDADHALYCEYCRMQVIVLRLRRPR